MGGGGRPNQHTSARKMPQKHNDKDPSAYGN